MKKLFPILTLTTLSLTAYAPIAHTATSCSLRINSAYQSSLSSDIYYITENCTKQLFRSEADFLTYFKSTSAINRIDDLTLRVVPNDVEKYVPARATPDTPPPSTGSGGTGNSTGSQTSGRSETLILRDGSVIKSRNNNSVYLVINNVKYHIANGETFTELGLRTQWIETVSDTVLNAIPTGSTLNMFPNSNLMSEAVPNYMLFKDKNSAHVYRVEPSSQDPKYQVLRKITTEAAFKRLNYRADRLPQVTIYPFKEISLIGINTKTIFREGTDFTTQTDLIYKGTFADIMKERQSGTNANRFVRKEVREKIYYEYPSSYKVVRGFSYTRAFGNEYLAGFMKSHAPEDALYVSIMPLPQKNGSYTASELRDRLDTAHLNTVGFEQTDLIRKNWKTEIKTHTTLGQVKITTTEFTNGKFETRITVLYKNNIFSGLIKTTNALKPEFEEVFYLIASTFKRTN